MVVIPFADVSRLNSLDMRTDTVIWIIRIFDGAANVSFTDTVVIDDQDFYFVCFHVFEVDAPLGVAPSPTLSKSGMLLLHHGAENYISNRFGSISVEISFFEWPMLPPSREA
jgi:hypothetical protein